MIVTFQNHPVIWCLVVGLTLAVLVAWCIAGFMALKHAPLMEDVPPPKTPAGLRPEEKTGETRRTFELRESYVARRATREEIIALQDRNRAMALIRDMGGC